MGEDGQIERTRRRDDETIRRITVERLRQPHELLRDLRGHVHKIGCGEGRGS